MGKLFPLIQFLKLVTGRALEASPYYHKSSTPATPTTTIGSISIFLLLQLLITGKPKERLEFIIMGIYNCHSFSSFKLKSFYRWHNNQQPAARTGNESSKAQGSGSHNYFPYFFNIKPLGSNALYSSIKWNSNCLGVNLIALQPIFHERTSRSFCNTDFFCGCSSQRCLLTLPTKLLLTTSCKLSSNRFRMHDICFVTLGIVNI